MRVHVLVALMAVAACSKKASGTDDYGLLFLGGKTSSTVDIAGKRIVVPPGQQASADARGTVEIQVTTGDEHVTWTVSGEGLERFLVPLSKRQCFGLGTFNQQTAAPTKLALHTEPVQFPCGAKMSRDELDAFADGAGTYEDIIANDVSEKSVEDGYDSRLDRAFAEKVAKRTGYTVLFTVRGRSILVKDGSAVGLGYRPGAPEAEQAEVDQIVATIGKPDPARAGLDSFPMDDAQLRVTYESLADEFPALYAKAARRAFVVADAGRYGGMLFVYQPFGTTHLIRTDEHDALKKAGIALDAHVDKRVAAEAPKIEACLKKLKAAPVICATDRSETEAALRLFALIQRPDTKVVARLVFDPKTSEVVLEISPPGATPPRDPNASLPYSVAIDNGALRAL